MVGQPACHRVAHGTVGAPGALAWQHDVVEEGFVKPEPQDLAKAPDKTSTAASLSAGGMLSGGNSRLFGASVDARLRLRSDDDQLSAAGAANYSRGGPPRLPMTTTVENLQGRLRYDRFLSEHWVSFVGAQGRRDRFQGLALRAQLDPGMAYYFSDQPEDRFWLKAGYELLYDVRRNDARPERDGGGQLILDAAGHPILLDKMRLLSSARVFLGYSSNVNEMVNFSSNLEYITAAADTNLFRVNADATLTAKLRGRWSVAMRCSAAYENKPLPDKLPLDTSTSANLVYSFP